MTGCTKTALIALQTAVLLAVSTMFKHFQAISGISPVVGARLDIGIYLVQLATMVFGASMPSMKCVGQLSEEGVDAEGSLALTWPAGSASLLITLRAQTPETAVVMFEKGYVRLHGPAHCPVRMTVARASDRGVFKEEVIEMPLPKLKQGFKVIYPSSEGMAYEVSAVEKCIQEGKRLGSSS